MKVVIDLTPLYSAHQFRGIGFYTKRLIEALKKIAPKKGIELEFLKSADKLVFVEADIIHYPYFSPFFLTLPTKKLTKSIVTIHDLIPVKFMENFTPGVKGRIRWEVQKWRLKKIDGVITDSYYWQEEIPKLTGYPKEKIYVVPLAAGEEFKLVKGKSEKLKIKQKYQLPDKFILYVGDVNWNKNVIGLIKAFKIFNSQFSIYNLVLVGKAFEDKELKETKEIIQLIKELNLINKIKILGYVPTEDLVVIYNLASVYCQPSFSEGFGLPVLEAMACGCPVISANTSSLPEICGKSAILFDPYNIKNITQALVRIIKDEKKRNNLIKNGLEWVKNFSWEKTALKTVEVYEKVYLQRK
ncbi:MAG: glycosyltransferase family 4 protein [Microgenomates group bacterium]